MAEFTIEGNCDSRFARMRDAMAENFALREEVGASVAVVIDGRPVVDLWAGFADAARIRPWTADTIMNVFSTTKGLTAMCAHRLASQGRLDIEAPVARYWPEYAAAGKERIPVRMLLNHRAGQPAIRKKLAVDSLYDWDLMTTSLASEEPWWEPGTIHGYHAVTFGYLLGEVIRRITRKSIGAYFRDEIARPLGIDAHIGLDAREDVRTADMIGSKPPGPGEFNLFAEAQKRPESATAAAFLNPPTLLKIREINSRAWRGAEIPAANGHTNGRALARVYGALARGGSIDGVNVMAPERIESCSIEQSRGSDEVLMIPTRFSLGFMMSLPDSQMGPSPRAFGHPGAGGSIGFADPDARIGFGYAMNKMGSGILLDPRPRALIAALYESL